MTKELDTLIGDANSMITEDEEQARLKEETFEAAVNAFELIYGCNYIEGLLMSLRSELLQTLDEVTYDKERIKQLCEAIHWLNNLDSPDKV